jgi:hypothetical protein
VKNIVRKTTQQSNQFASGFLPQTPPPITSRPCSETAVIAVRRC